MEFNLEHCKSLIKVTPKGSGYETDITDCKEYIKKFFYPLWNGEFFCLKEKI